MQSSEIKASAHDFIDQLPDTVSSWSDLAYHVEVRASVERGLDDVRNGRVYTTDEIKAHLGLNSE